MDIATIIGVLCGFLCIFISIADSAAVFFNVPSILITVGGMLSATFIHFSLPQVLRIVPVAKKTLFCKLPSEQEIIQKMVNYSAICRRDGLLALEREVADVRDPFLGKSLRMVISGQEEQAVGAALSTEIRFCRERHEDGRRILSFMGSSAPAFGMIGTLIGLVMMLRQLDDPSKIGSGMAVALLTTFYGALLANLVFIPLSGKLGIRSRQETLMREMIVEGVIGMVRGESPTVVQERMQAFLSAKNREELRPTIGRQQRSAQQAA